MAVDTARAKSLFLAASDLADPAQRAAFLDSECGCDAELRARVEALLRANDAAPLSPAGDGMNVQNRLPRTEDYGDPTARVGAVLAGKYKLVEEIGEGGMGSVFMAQQTEPVKRAVAVKVIKAGMDSSAMLARFEAERQAIAMMDHPNIAKVLDAGTTDGGRPFFVMELVKGKPITSFCDERKLTPKQRLELFVSVCQAIQHAHQKGIIHRDLKPSNVLVALYDDRPVAKIIDFGVAKAAGQALTDKTLMTGFGAMVGTPEYMSPEQANLNNLDIDTRSDVYSLGVLLYELLTGTTPVDRKSLGKAAMLEILRIVREVEPPKPSAKLSTIDTLPSVAANRGTEPAKLSKLMKGELDWVVLKALEKDRARRYESSNGLARDIQRYLADEVVEARPPSPGYRLKKYVKRNKGPVVAASLLLSALLAGMAGTTWGLLQARQSAEAERLANDEAQAKKTLAEANEAKAIAAAGRERQAKSDADDKRREAEANLAFATKANAILGSVFEGLDPKADYATVAELRNSLRDNLNKAVAELEGSSIGEPLDVAAMQVTLGASLVGLGEASLAVEVFQKALATRKAKLGPDHPDTLASMDNLACAYLTSGQLAAAVPLFEETLVKRKARLGSDHSDTLGSMNNLAEAYEVNGQLGKAMPLFEETLEKSKAKLGLDHPDTLDSMHNLAAAYWRNGELAKAVPLHEETLEKRKARLGHDHPHTLLSMIGLAVAYHDSGQLAKAVPLYEETLVKRKAKLGPDHPDTLISMNNLALAYADIGKLAKAVPLFEETLEKRKAKLGPDHPHTLSSMNALAGAYQASDELAKAVPLFEETLEKRKAKLGPDHPDTVKSVGNLAGAYRDSGQLDRAVPLFEETLERMKAKLGPDHPDTLKSMGNLAGAYLATGQLAKAVPLFEETLEKTKAELGLDHPDTLISMNNLAKVYLDSGQLAKALPLLEETMEKMKAKFGPDHPHTLKCMNNLGLAWLDSSQLAKAAPLLEETLPKMKAMLGPDHPDTLVAMNNLGAVYRNAGKPELALPLLEQIIELRSGTLGPEHPDMLQTMGNLAATYWSLKRLDKSIPVFEQTLKLVETKHGRDHPTTQMTVANLGVNYKDAGRLQEAIPLLEEAYRTSRKYHNVNWVSEPLQDAYAKAGETAKLAGLLLERLAEARKALPKDSPQLAGLLAQIGLGLSDQKRWDDAEPLFRECLAIREKQIPESWLTFNTQSMLGGVLLGQEKHADAEPLLVRGYEGMKAREETIPSGGELRIPEALDRLIALYTATNNPDEVKKWQTKRAKYPDAKKPIAPEK
jgi:serine/threonine protein kinase